MLRPKEVVCKWVDAFNNHDVDAIVSLYHDNATNHQVTNDPVIGIEAIREMFTAEFATADMTAIVENIFEDGQWAILEWKDPLGLRGCGFFHVVNGKILFQRGYWDKLSFLKQPCREVHHIPGSPAAEAIEVILVQLQAGVSVVVERAANHPGTVDFQPIVVGGLSERDRRLDCFKNVHLRNLLDFFDGFFHLPEYTQKNASNRKIRHFRKQSKKPP